MHAYPVSAEVALQASPPRQIAVSKATAEDAAQRKAAAILAEVHTQDLPAVLASVRGSRPKEDAERVSGLTALIGPIAPDVATLAGTYVMSEQSGYPVSKITFLPEDISLAPPSAGAELEACPCTTCAAHSASTKEVYCYMNARRDNCTFRSRPLGWLMRSISGPVVYTFTVSSDGVLRFHVPRGLPLWKKAIFAFIDSETTRGFVKNVKHSEKHGCFCFGLFFSTAVSEEGENSKHVIMRYNRWGDGGPDMVPYWCAVQA